MKPGDATLAREMTLARILAPLLLVFAVLWFCNLEYRDLVRPDEGRYAEIAREMATTGDWITPRLNAVKYFEKPPLQYWMTAGAYRAFGESEWTARLWTASTGFAGVLFTGFAGMLLFGRRAGFYAAIVLGSATLYAAMGHISTLDMGIAFWMTLGLGGFLLAQRAQATPASARLWTLLAWAAMGFAFLSKGLIGAALPAAALVAYVALQRDLSPLKRLHPIAGLCVFLAIALPWIVAVSIANPEFPRFFFIHEHFERFLTASHRRTAPWWFFVPILLIGALPWSAMLVPASRKAWKTPVPPGHFDFRRFLLIYAGVIFLFFSASHSKLPSYILPMFPALALLIGDWLSGARGKAVMALTVPGAIAALAGIAAGPFFSRYVSDKVPAHMYATFGWWVFAGSLALLAACVAAMNLARRGKIAPAVVVLGFGGLLFVQIGMTGHQALSPSTSTAIAAVLVKPHIDADTTTYSVRTYEQTLPFYVKRTFTLVDYADEFEFGLQQEPGLEIQSIEEFESRWRNDRKAIAVMGPDVYQELAKKGLPMQLLSEDPRRIIVAKP